MRNESNILGTVIKAARKKNLLTREQLAEKVKITPRYLMSIENEDKKPSYDVLFRLIRELGISADMVFFPEKSADDTEKEEIIRLLYFCKERELKVIRATINALLNSK